MSQNQIEQIEISITEARKMVERGKMAEKLQSNRAFKELVSEGYFVEEAARLVHLSSDPNLQPNLREAVLRDMNGPGAFRRYLMTIVQMGKVAETEIAEAQEMIEEIREEEYTSDENEE